MGDGGRELRVYTLDALTVRAADGDEGAHIEGHAAVFNTWTTIWDFRECVAPGAFTRAIGEDDVRALLNHDPNYVLGRNMASTLDLAEDDRGLAVSITPPATSWASDLLVSMARGDVDQMSFGFGVNKERWEWNGDDEIWERTILEVAPLWDVSVVTFAAYPTTDAQVRALGLYRAKPPQGRGDDMRGQTQGSAVAHRRRRRRLELIERSL